MSAQRNTTEAAGGNSIYKNNGEKSNEKIDSFRSSSWSDI